MRRRRLWIPAIGALEGDQRRQHASGIRLEHRATATRAAIFCYAVKIVIAALHQWGLWIVAIRPVERDQRRQYTGGGHFKQRAKAGAAVETEISTVCCCAVEIAIGALHQSGRRIVA